MVELKKTFLNAKLGMVTHSISICQLGKREISQY